MLCDQRRRHAGAKTSKSRAAARAASLLIALSMLLFAVSSPLGAGAQDSPTDVGRIVAELKTLHEREPIIASEITNLDAQIAQARQQLAIAEDQQRDAQTATRAAKQRATSLAVVGWISGSALASDSLAGLAPEPVRSEEILRGALNSRLQQLDQYRGAQDKSNQAVSDASAQLTVLRRQRDDKIAEQTTLREQTKTLLTKLADLLSVPVGSLGIPRAALESYVHAARVINSEQPGCDLPWWLLAGVGKVESNHGRGNYLADGRVDPPILGIVLDGSRSLAIADTDDGVYDGDIVWDRAVGPMQFIPGTWNGSGRDANGDGVRDPQNMFDAVLASSGYLCRAGLRAGGNLSTSDEAQRAALWSYNPNESYDDKVLGFATLYSQVGLPSGFTILTPLPGTPS